MPVVARLPVAAGRLAIVLRGPHLPALAGRPRRMADERAARIARALAIPSATDAGYCTVSTSHTEGSAAALWWREGRKIGVDLVRVTRVTCRHAEAILTSEDWRALEVAPSRLRPALGWAIKEAAAKATGAAQHYFPMGIRIVPGCFDGTLRARCTGEMYTLFNSVWLVLGGVLCVTVVECETEHSRSAHIRQVECKRLPGMNSDLDENMFAMMTCGVHTDA